MKEILEFIRLFGILIISILLIYFIITTINDIKNYKKKTEKEKRKYKAILVIFLIPIILWIIDYYNVISIIYPNYENISRDYDWLSFIGAYIGTIVSAILLIFITEKDRTENTNVLRAAQRPYLDIVNMKIKDSYFDKEHDGVIVFEHGNAKEKAVKRKEYLTLCIKNNGASVAIIDTNKTNVIIQYKENDKMTTEIFRLNFSINRLSLKSGEELDIKFCKNDLYENGKLLPDSSIIKTQVYYKDLFNKNYFDECEMGKTWNILHDNEEI